MSNEFNLSDKIDNESLPMMEPFIFAKHVKEKVQNAQRRLKEDVTNIGNVYYDWRDMLKIINKIFKEEFGAKLI